MWAAGIIMHMILTGKHPFYKRKDKSKKTADRVMIKGWTRCHSCSE